MRTLLSILFLLLLTTLGARARAEMKTCDGPDPCCPKEIAHDKKTRAVDVGVVVLGVDDVSEKSSTWTADFYLYEQWIPAPGFLPQTEIVNETERKSEQFDSTEFDGTRCQRSRRIRSVLKTPFNLRTFPFDTQSLRLELSDSEYDSTEVTYGDKPRNSGLEEAVTEQISEREILPSIDYKRERSLFNGEGKEYDYGIFTLRAKRGWGFHLSKYFLPLFLIVIVSFSVFWIDPEDLSSAVQVGVTCMLAAIALQLAYASSLPNVNYLTIADWLFSISYGAIALSVLQTVYTNRLARDGKKPIAHRIDAWCRRWFPIMLVGAIVITTLRAFLVK